MKLTIAPLLLSSAVASSNSKAGKFAKFPKAKAAKSGYHVSSMSTTMSVGPPPTTPAPKPAPTTVVQACGETFTDQKVVLANNLDCVGPPRAPGTRTCALTLDGSKAEINCNDYKISQIASQPEDYPYLDGPFFRGICLYNRAKARNCKVEQFYDGIYAQNGAEVRSSVLSPNANGIYAESDVDSALIISDM